MLVATASKSILWTDAGSTVGVNITILRLLPQACLAVLLDHIGVHILLCLILLIVVKYWYHVACVKTVLSISAGVGSWIKKGWGWGVIVLCWGRCFELRSVLQCCWLADRKGVWHMKTCCSYLEKFFWGSNHNLESNLASGWSFQFSWDGTETVQVPSLRTLAFCP